jgi:hypothetical protein
MGCAGPEGRQGPQGERGPEGAPGNAGFEGPQGDPGPTGPTGATGPMGPTGPAGPTGTNGTSVTIKGSYPDEATLVANQPSGNIGDGYLVNGSLYVWTGSAWEDVGKILGPTGPTGPTGPQGNMGLRGPQGPTGAPGPNPNIQPYNANLSVNGSQMDILIDHVILRVSHNGSGVRLTLMPESAPLLIDLRRSTVRDGANQASKYDDYELKSALVFDDLVYGSSRETHITLLRQRDPLTFQWSLHEIRLFVSNKNERVSVWVTQIYTDENF